MTHPTIEERPISTTFQIAAPFKVGDRTGFIIDRVPCQLAWPKPDTLLIEPHDEHRVLTVTYEYDPDAEVDMVVIKVSDAQALSGSAVA